VLCLRARKNAENNQPHADQVVAAFPSACIFVHLRLPLYSNSEDGLRVIADMPTPPDEIAPGYRFNAELSPGTYRCVGPDGRLWVLKRLDDDCLHAGGLHPAIRDRLARVRELPHARVATLAAVVRGTDGPYLVWAFVQGQPIDPARLSADRFPAVARGLASAVETLHARGLVHGSLTAGNVILSPAGDVWLTHLSPYLWDDPADDVRAVLDLLRPAADGLSLPLPDLADGVPTQPLRELAAGGPSRPPPAERDGPRHARRSLLGAAAVAVLAIAAAGFIARWAARSAAHADPATSRPEVRQP